MFSGFYSNHIDIAPNFTGTIMAICNTCATISGFVVPVFVGEMTHANQTLERWQIIFYTTAAVLLFDFVVYGLLASGEEQPWNQKKTTASPDKNDTCENESAMNFLENP